MKKVIMTLCLLVVAVNVHAERKFVLVDLHHLENKDFYPTDSFMLSKNITKPQCQSGGMPEIDIGNSFLCEARYVGRAMVKIINGSSYFWTLVIPSSTSFPGCDFNISARVYCTYPIQCIKQ